MKGLAISSGTEKRSKDHLGAFDALMKAAKAWGLRPYSGKASHGRIAGCCSKGIDPAQPLAILLMAFRVLPSSEERPA
jgi:hypothetical protein